MARYHINPKTLKVGRCSAKTVATCRYKDASGQPFKHYPTVELAQRAAAREAAKEQRLLPKVAKRAKLPPRPPVSVIPETLQDLPRFPSDRVAEARAMEAYGQRPSAFSCGSCDRRFTQAEATLIISANQVLCRHDEEKLLAAGHSTEDIAAMEEWQSWKTVRTEARPEYSDILADTSRAKARRWMHATERGPQWFQELQEAQARVRRGEPTPRFEPDPPMVVHAGAPEAAVDRVLTYANRNIPSCRAHDGNKTIYLFELELAPEVQVEEEVVEDAAIDDAREREAGTAAVYLNIYEAPGTVSVVAPAESWRVIGYQQVMVQDLWQCETLYNIPCLDRSPQEEAEELASAEEFTEEQRELLGLDY